MGKNIEMRAMVRGMYDIQKLRIQIGNRIVANFKARELGQSASKSEKELADEERNILKELRAGYKKITDGVKSFPSKNKFKPNELISTYIELCLVRSYISLEIEENEMIGQIGQALKDYRIYTEFLEKVKGCGPLMSGVILSEIDIHESKYASSIQKYAGLDVVIEDGLGRSRRKEHLVDVEYVDSYGDTQTKKSITFNPMLKTKLIGVLGSGFLKCKSPYSEIYYNYKNRLKNHPKHAGKSDGHIHAMSIRYMIKRFIVDLYVAWRTIEGLPVADEYSVAKLGHVHGSGPTFSQSKE